MQNRALSTCRSPAIAPALPQGGNAWVNSVWEGGAGGTARPSAASSDAERAAFIQAKYVRRELIRADLAQLARGGQIALAEKLHAAVADRSVRVGIPLKPITTVQLTASTCLSVLDSVRLPLGVGFAVTWRCHRCAGGCRVPRRRSGPIRPGHVNHRGRCKLFAGAGPPLSHPSCMPQS